MGHTNKRTLDDVLAWVNERRHALALGAPLKKLPKGERGMCSYCPIAIALNTAVVPTGYYLPDANRGVLVKFPDFVAEFIADFDRGRYPELVSSVYSIALAEIGL